MTRAPDLYRLRHLLPHTIWIAYAKALADLLGPGAWQLPPRSFQRALAEALRGPELHRFALGDLRTALPAVVLCWLLLGAWRAWRGRRRDANPARLPWAI